MSNSTRRCICGNPATARICRRCGSEQCSKCSGRRCLACCWECGCRDASKPLLEIVCPRGRSCLSHCVFYSAHKECHIASCARAIGRSDFARKFCVVCGQLQDGLVIRPSVSWMARCAEPHGRRMIQDAHSLELQELGKALPPAPSALRVAVFGCSLLQVLAVAAMPPGRGDVKLAVMADLIEWGGRAVTSVANIMPSVFKMNFRDRASARVAEAALSVGVWLGNSGVSVASVARPVLQARDEGELARMLSAAAAAKMRMFGRFVAFFSDALITAVRGDQERYDPDESCTPEVLGATCETAWLGTAELVRRHTIATRALLGCREVALVASMHLRSVVDPELRLRAAEQRQRRMVAADRAVGLESLFGSDYRIRGREETLRQEVESFVEAAQLTRRQITDRLHLIRCIRAGLLTQLPEMRVVLYGSHLHGCADAASPIDLACVCPSDEICRPVVSEALDAVHERARTQCASLEFDAQRGLYTARAVLTCGEVVVRLAVVPAAAGALVDQSAGLLLDRSPSVRPAFYFVRSLLRRDGILQPDTLVTSYSALRVLGTIASRDVGVPLTQLMVRFFDALASGKCGGALSAPAVASAVRSDARLYSARLRTWLSGSGASTSLSGLEFCFGMN